MLTFKLLLVAGVAGVVVAAPAAESLPQVDLGYEIHQAISLNETTQIYNFSNIRYAAAPVGDLRWAPPVAPTGRDTTVNNGSVGRICPAIYPAWEYIAEVFTEWWINGTGNSFPFAFAEAELQQALANATLPKPDPRTSEDCLFLDVFVPKSVMSTKKNPTGKGGAAVLIWIYGGGYVEGSKGGSGSPEVLMSASRAAGEEIIFVELNYRLGALGWLAGPSLQAAGGVSNAGLYDQRFAINWVSENIHLFGGDPTRITVMGESAGGGSIMHQITAFGGTKPVKFQQAILQSPGWLPIVSNYIQENTTQTFLGILGVKSIAEARNASSLAVITANAKQVLNAPYGEYIYGPTVDGVFAPALPGQLLAEGKFAKNVKVMAGHNAEEGVIFCDPRAKTDAELATYLKGNYYNISDADVNYIVKTLYPAVYDGTYPYRSPIDRTITIITESIFSCNTYYLARAGGNQTYNYEFEVPPAIHGEDVASTFYNGEGLVKSLSGVVVPQVAQALQAYITSFVQTGNPNRKGLPQFPMYGMNATEEGLNITGIKTQIDPTANQRCAWWQHGLST